MKKNDYVINRELIDDIVPNSVGIVRELTEDSCYVLFIGKNKTIKASVHLMEVININETGDSFRRKICNVCHILKDTTEFEYNQNKKGGIQVRRPSCRSCRKIIDGKGLSLKDKKEMEKIKPKDLFQCPICGKFSIPGVTANLVIDHDHTTGAPREWICDSCNTGLGRFKDDINVLEIAIKYLKDHS